MKPVGERLVLAIGIEPPKSTVRFEKVGRIEPLRARLAVVVAEDVQVGANLDVEISGGIECEYFGVVLLPRGEIRYDGLWRLSRHEFARNEPVAIDCGGGRFVQPAVVDGHTSATAGAELADDIGAPGTVSVAQRKHRTAFQFGVDIAVWRDREKAQGFRHVAVRRPAELAFASDD